MKVISVLMWLNLTSRLLYATWNFKTTALNGNFYIQQECCLNQMDLKAFIQLSEHIACHLRATFGHGDPWQPQILSMPLPTIRLGPQWQDYKRLYIQA